MRATVPRWRFRGGSRSASAGWRRLCSGASCRGCPTFSAVGLEGRYFPAAEAKLGGDWYDAFTVPGGRLGMAIGDVSGRGFHAAALMGQLRSGLRAYAMDGGSPSEVVERLSQLLRQLEPGRNATLLYLLLDPQEGSLLLASAGHPPPLVLNGDGDCSFVELPGSVPLGAVRYASYEEVETRLEPGATLVLYTDGVVERPGEPLDAGLERLREAVAAGREPRRSATRSSAALLPAGATRDDAALLVARALPLSNPLELRLPADVDTIPTLRRVLGTLAERGRGVNDRGGGDLACVLGGLRECHRARVRARPGRDRGDRHGDRGSAGPDLACATSGAGVRRGAATAAAGWC